MLLRILKKDARLLWWLAAIMLAVRAGQAFLAWHNGIFPDDGRQIGIILEVLVGYFAAAFLIVMAVHQDGLVGPAQDWLVRPIDRRLLLLAKLLFAVVLVLAPYFLLKLATGIFHGFSFGESVGAAFVATMLELFFLVLPAMMLGAVTQNLAQTLGAIMCAFLLTTFAQPIATHLGAALALNQAQFDWQAAILQPTIILAGATAVLWLAYVRRNILWARIGCGITFAGYLAVYLLPFPVLFALQQAVTPNAKAADTIRIAYDPSIPPSQFAGTEPGLVHEGKLPIRITGLPPDTVVRADYLALRLVSADGHVLYRESEKNRLPVSSLNFDGLGSFKLLHAGQGLGERGFHQVFALPTEVYASLKDMWLRVEVDYAITVLGRHSTAVVPMLFSRRYVAGLGVCESRMSGTYKDTVEVWCYPASDNARCVLGDIKNAGIGVRNGPHDNCEPVYRPRLLAAVDKLKPAIPAFFEDKAYRPGTTPSPVAIERLPAPQQTIAGYTPEAHIWRHLGTPLVRLRDL